MKVIITAGGTSERIDDVRSITNTSTGRLGHTIGETVCRMYGEKLEKLYYLHGIRAQALNEEKVENIRIEGVRDLEGQMKRLLTEEKIDAVIHAMAVSDYMVKEVTTLEQIKAETLRAAVSDAADGEEETGDVYAGASAAGCGAAGSGRTEKQLAGNKISSSIEDLTIVLQRAPKVIGMIKSTSPETILVGFKLLSHVPREELITVAHNLLQKNACTYVLANDLSEINSERHRGYLVHRDKSYDTMETNAEIAEMIAKRIQEELD